MREAKVEEKDMISALPEDLLVTILLLVPIKDAVATMILSKRWRLVWMMLPRLEYKENCDDDDFDCIDNHLTGNKDDEGKKSIWWFFDKSMKLHKAPVLEILHIKLGPGCPSDADVGKWILKAVYRHVVVLKFMLCWSANPTRLPKSLYNCKTLKELVLSHKILVDLPSSCCLPSLITLDLLYVVYNDEASLGRLLSSCPVLEELQVKRNKDDNVRNFSVKVSSLESLWYTNFNDVFSKQNYKDFNDVVDTGRCLAFDTPALKHIQITDYSRDSCSAENMHFLENANIDVTSFPDIDKFTTSLSRVLSLRLFMTDEVLVRCSTINFSRLIKLTICPDTSDWLKQFLLLLENAPKLKDLLVDDEYALIRPKIPLSWNEPCSIPGCLSSQLEIFEWREYGGREEEEELLTYILANSMCLKTAAISLKPTVDLKEQELIRKLLRDIHRVSTTSQLLFN